MRRATITSVALPNGLDPARSVARVSVFLSPRLESDESDLLGQFGDFLDWPAALRPASVRYALEVAGHGTVAARVVSARPRSDLWRALFDAGTYVRTRRLDEIVSGPMVSYPLARIAAYMKERYQRVSTGHATAPPPREVVAEQFRELFDVARPTGGGREATDRRVEATLDAARERAARRESDDAVVAADDLPDGPQRDFAQFELFHHQPAGATSFAAGLDDGSRLIDFHAAISALGDHPALLRQLGLVIDLELDRADLPGAPFGIPGKLRVRPIWDSGAAPAVSVEAPWVAYASFDRFFCIGGHRKSPGGIGDEIVGGMVQLHNGAWDLIQVDVDGAAFKAIGAAAAADPSPGGEQSLAALRSAGFTLARRQTTDVVHRALSTQRQAAAGARDADAPFFAEDVTRGYRLDVFEARTGRWRSLHERRVSYEIPDGPPIAPVTDEGFLQRAVRHPAGARGEPPRPEAELYVHDALCRWDGWSLAAPHPGKAISHDPRAPDDDIPETQPQRVRNAPIAGGIPLAVNVAAKPGSLPRLRTGETYRVRLRTVDLAGNSPSLSDADALTQSFSGSALPGVEGERYLRFEPLGSPELVPRAEVREGESLAHLAIRSDPDLGAVEWARAHGYRAVCERHVVPPKTSQLMAERHGMFDAAIGTGGSTLAAYRAATKEKGTLTDADVLLSDGSRVRQRVRLVHSAAGDYVVNEEPRLIVPYLPDPLAAGVTIAGAPGVEPGMTMRVSADGQVTHEASPRPLDPDAPLESLVTIAFGSPERWPETGPFLLRLAEGAATPEWDRAGRVLTLHLPKAGRVQLSVSCHPPDDQLDDLGLRAWAAERLDAESGGDRTRSAEHARVAAAGRAWQISPARTLALVHAVQRPVRAPAVLSLAAERTPGSTFTALAGEIRVHGESSERLELIADWTDTIDQDGPTEIKGTAHVLDHRLNLARDNPGHAPADGPIAAIGFDEAHDMVALRPSVPADPAHPQPRHELGDTRHRVIGYRAVATSRFREYFDPALAADPANVSRASARVEVNVPSSARPPAPRVVYVIPAFGWGRGTAPDSPATRIARRRGGGLRVYLDRPWFASGVGEQLGVMLWPSASAEPPAAVEGLVTRWARDPLWVSPPLEAVPTLAHFPRATRTASGLTPMELAAGPAGLQLSIAGHDVGYDATRRLWYCDIELRAGVSHTPFVRLALARWQPQSLPGLELSRVVTAQFAQLSPDRAVTVVRHAGEGIVHIDLSITGPICGEGPWSLTGLQIGSSGSTVEVVVQRRLAGTSGDAGWVDAMGDPGVRVRPDALAPDPALRWSGQVEVPSGGAPGTFRIAAREYERFAGPRRRLLFAETVEL